MKRLFLLLVLFCCTTVLQGESENLLGSVELNVSSTSIDNYKTKGFVQYSDFGAVGDGKADDIKAIVATHAFANKHRLLVKADEEAIYYIGGEEHTAIIQTDTDFGSAQFIVDDRDVHNREASIFEVTSTLKPLKIESLSALKRNQQKIDVSLPMSCLVAVTDTGKRRYIRYGRNQNNGHYQKDVFIVDKEGYVDMEMPIIWDFDQIADSSVLPIDTSTLKITGGRFTTIANSAKSEYNYFGRNIEIKRSNVLVDRLEHRIVGEGEHGAPYRGFISIANCSDVTIKNTILTGHKKYETIGAAGTPVSMGSYDISVNMALNVSFENCRQTNDIDDRKYWGIMASNYSKNLSYDNCILSRFDAHMGVVNATIRNSTLGHMGINAIGSGILTVENCTIRGRSIVNLREDYGSTWQGQCVIRNCTFVPRGDQNKEVCLITGYNSGQHDFGYTCYMPESIIVENLHINDSNCHENYQGPAVFANFNSKMIDDSYQEKFPYVKTKRVVLRNVSSDSQKPLTISANQYMFKGVEIDAESSEKREETKGFSVTQ